MQDDTLTNLPPLPPLPPCEPAFGNVPVLKNKRAARCKRNAAETIPKVSPLARRNGLKGAQPLAPLPPPLEVSVPFKAATLACADVRAHLVCEAAAHLLYMQQQIPIPWPKCVELHTAALAERAAEAATLLPGARRRGISTGPARHLTQATTVAAQLFDTVRTIFSPNEANVFGGRSHPVRVALVFGPCPRRAQWVVLLDFAACRAPSHDANSEISGKQMHDNCRNSVSGASAEDKRVLDACGRRLKRALLEVAMQTPTARGGSMGGATARASKLHVLLQFNDECGKVADAKTGLVPCTVAADEPGNGAFNFDNAAAVLPRSRLPAALLRAIVEPHELGVGIPSVAAAQRFTSSGRRQRPPKGWPNAPWVIRFRADGATCKSTSSAAQREPQHVGSSPTNTSTKRLSAKGKIYGSATSAAAQPASPTKRQRPPSPAAAATTTLDQYEPESTEIASESESDSSTRSDSDNASEDDSELGDLRRFAGSDGTHEPELSQQSMEPQESPRSDRITLSPLKPLPELGVVSKAANGGEELPWFYLHNLVVKGVPQGKSTN